MQNLARGFLLTLLLCALPPVWAEAPRDPYRFFFQDSFGDFAEELERARQDGKKGVLIFFELDDCPFCHRMKQTVLNQPAVQDYFREHFLLFSVDIEGDIEVVDFDGEAMTSKQLAEDQYRVRATPVFAFFDLDGQMVARYTGATSGPEEFMWLGEYVADGHYQTTKFTRYKRAKKKENR